MSELLCNVYGLLKELVDFCYTFNQKNDRIDKESTEAIDKTLKLTDYIENCHIEIEALAEGISERARKVVEFLN